MLDIRQLQRQDHVTWLPLWRGYQEFYKIALSDEVTQAAWDRFFDPNELMFAIGAFDDGVLVGISHYNLYRSTGVLTHVCYLQDLFTIPEHRGKGVGRALIEAVATSAREKGAERLFWHTHETNAQARALYDTLAERSGFIHYRKVL